MEKILIVRMGAMGDVIHGLPAAASLRQRFPDAHIGWVIERRWSDLLSAQGAATDAPLSPEKPLVNEIFEVDTKSWRRALFAAKTRRELTALVREIRAQDFDVTVDLQGSLKSAVSARASDARRILGPAKPREFPAQWFYTQTVQTTRAHVIEQYAEIMRPVSGATNLPLGGSKLLPRDRGAELWRDQELLARGLKGWRYALLSAGAGWKAKEWPAERYGELARHLAKDGIRSLINAGPADSDLAEIIERSSGGHAQPIRCNISQLIALTRNASLFVGGDTGPMHLANLLGVPVVAIYGPTDPARNGPFFQPSVILRDIASKTTYSHAKSTDAGLQRITVSQVLDAASSLLVKA
ncbi:MAG TPA: glycosyltransferase family 9 protein [Terriglobales bacterium]|nr:glycosyltransferase family 9 protein [Terriglobales bacterium]